MNKKLIPYIKYILWKFINVRWFLIVQLVENSVFASPKIFKTELVLRFLQITEKPIQKMIQEMGSKLCPIDFWCRKFQGESQIDQNQFFGQNIPGTRWYTTESKLI